MSNELVAQDPNRLENKPTASNAAEFAKPDNSRQANAVILEPKQEKLLFTLKPLNDNIILFIYVLDMK